MVQKEDLVRLHATLLFCRDGRWALVNDSTSPTVRTTKNKTYMTEGRGMDSVRKVRSVSSLWEMRGVELLMVLAFCVSIGFFLRQLCEFPRYSSISVQLLRFWKVTKPLLDLLLGTLHGCSGVPCDFLALFAEIIVSIE